METLIIHPSDSSQSKALIKILKAFNISFERKKTKAPYHPDFIKMMDKSIEEAKQGKLTKIELDDLWK